MSKTELEEELCSTFERAAASVPPIPDLISRTEAGVDRQRRTWAASGVAAVGVASLAVAGVLVLSGPEAGPVRGPQPASSPSVPASTSASAPTSTMMSGSWRPRRMAGFTTMAKARPQQPVLAFATDGTWTGSDGCNRLSGTFTIGAGGQFSSTIGPQRLAGCDNVPHTVVLAAAKKVSADRANLRFFAADGQELASYARTR